MRELRERLERGLVLLQKARDEAPQDSNRRARLSGTVEGVELALSYIDEEQPSTEIVLPRLVGNARYAEGLVTPEVTHNGLVVIDFGECYMATDNFLTALLVEVKESGAAGILVRRATDEMTDRVATLAAGVQVQTVVAG